MMMRMLNIYDIADFKSALYAVIHIITALLETHWWYLGKVLGDDSPKTVTATFLTLTSPRLSVTEHS